MQIQRNGLVRSSSLNRNKATGETSKGAAGTQQADSFTPSTATGNEPSFINPGSIVVVGGSEKPGPGNTLMENLLRSYDGEHGNVHVVNIRGGEIHGKKAYKSVTELPDSADMAIITIPAKFVPDTIRQCGEKGIKNAVVISAGFKEAENGEALQADLVAAQKESGVRVMGPNCLGIINTKIGLDASFAAGFTPPGTVDVISQSGGILDNLRARVQEQGAGLNTMWSLGNKLDVDEAFALEEISKQGGSDVVVMYTEGVKDGRKFLDAVKKTSKDTPVVILKGGRSAQGAKAASSHTGSLAGAAGIFDAAMEKAGAIVVKSTPEAANLATFFSMQPVPEGKRLGIVTNGGGPGILATDNADYNGLEMAGLEPARVEKLGQDLAALGAPYAGLQNPIDVVGDAGADRYEVALEAVMEDPNVDSVLVSLVAVGPSDLKATADAIGRVSKKFKKPVVASFTGAGAGVEEGLARLRELGIPAYTDESFAVQALGHAARYKELQDIAAETNDEPSLLAEPNKAEARAILDKAKAEGRRNLGAEDVFQLLRSYGVPIVASGMAGSKEQALAIAEKIEYPVALKVAADDIVHKKDLDGKALPGQKGVYINIKTPEELAQKYDKISDAVKASHPDTKMDGIHVVKMADNDDAWEVIVGSDQDPIFGPTVMYGQGGTYVEVDNDVDFEIAPATPKQIRRELQGLKIGTKLGGVRGDEPSNIKLLSQVASRVSQLAHDFSDYLQSVEVNPFFVYQGAEGVEGVVAVDARAALKGAKPAPHH